jgi:glycosyltransferase involved in cell wall biosynthesis
MSRRRDRMKEVSIIIPTENNGDIIEKCLHSIKNLDYLKDKYEVIIVDEHSRERHTIR